MTPVWRTAAFAGLALGSLVHAAPVEGQDSTGAAPVANPPSMVVPVAAVQVPLSPAPPGGRYTFTRDSLLWSSAVTLADLLAAVPGVYVARAGFLGQPEYVAFAGRGAAALEIYWDGVPLVPLGGDSIFADASRIYLTFLQRVDVEVLPAALRVYLVSERHEAVSPRSGIGVMSGDFRTAQYTGFFQKRWIPGLGLHLGANFVGSDGASGSGRHDQVFELWARGEWLPRENLGASYQIWRQDQQRDPVSVGSTVATPARQGRVTRAMLRLHAATPGRGPGSSGTLTLGSSAWTHDTTIADRRIELAAATVGYHWSRGAVEGTGRLSDGPERRSVQARAAWAPVPGIVASGRAQFSGFSDERSGQRSHAAVALSHGPLTLVAELAASRWPEAPAVAADTGQPTADRALRAVLDTRPLTLSASLTRRDAYRPRAFPDLRLVPRVAPTPAATYLVSELRLQPLPPLTVTGWYAHPREGGTDFQPPHHARAQVTFRSKFWRTFRSGAFDLKVQLSVESWSAGTAGRTASGTLIPLPGLTFWESFLSLQIVGFSAFWDLRNAFNTRDAYVPGMPMYPRNAQTFGVKWVFAN